MLNNGTCELGKMFSMINFRFLQYRHVNFTKLRKLSQIATTLTTFGEVPQYDP